MLWGTDLLTWDERSLYTDMLMLERAYCKTYNAHSRRLVCDMQCGPHPPMCDAITCSIKGGIFSHCYYSGDNVRALLFGSRS